MNCDLGGEGKGEKSGTTGHKTGGYQSVNREVLRVGGKGWGRKVACCGRESKDLGVRQMCVPTLGYCMIDHCKHFYYCCFFDSDLSLT